MTTWHVHSDGLHVFVDGKAVAVIPFGQFGELIYRLIAVMRR